MSDDDMIRRRDALALFQPETTFFRRKICEQIRDLPAVQPRVQPDRPTFDAMCAMRDAINEYVPMPSLESDLLQGPENSVFCSTVAEAVIAEVQRLRSALTVEQIIHLYGADTLCRALSPIMGRETEEDYERRLAKMKPPQPAPAQQDEVAALVADVQALRDRMAELLRAVIWAYDRITVERITLTELAATAHELEQVMLRKPSHAATYDPTDFMTSPARKVLSRAALAALEGRADD